MAGLVKNDDRRYDSQTRQEGNINSFMTYELIIYQVSKYKTLIIIGRFEGGPG